MRRDMGALKTNLGCSMMILVTLKAGISPEFFCENLYDVMNALICLDSY